MSRGVNWWSCVTAAIASLCCAAVGAIRWLGPADLVQAFVPLGRAPLFVGTLGAVLVYTVVQALPGGRDPLWIPRPPHDGWSAALGFAMLCGSLAAFPIVPDGSLDVIVSAPIMLLATALFIDRLRRVQRQLAQRPFAQQPS
jgi:hypothetical protein